MNIWPARLLTGVFFSPEIAQMLASITPFYIEPWVLRRLSGNAKVAGMSTDLDLVGLRYNTAAAVFFVRISP